MKRKPLLALMCSVAMLSNPFTMWASTISSDNALEMVDEDTETVKMVQEKLNEKGYNCGTPDGIAGPNTQNAIIQFKKDNGLTEDAKITQSFLDKLTEEKVNSDKDTRESNIDNSKGTLESSNTENDSDMSKEEKPQDVSTDNILLDSNDILAEFRGIEKYSSDSWIVNLYIENNSQSEVYVSISDNQINKCTVGLSNNGITISSNTKYLASPNYDFIIELSDLEAYGISEIDTMDFTLSVRTGWMGDTICETPVHLDMNEKLPTTNKETISTNKETVLDNDNILAEFLGIEEYSSQSWVVSMYIENNNDTEIYVSLEDNQINGFSLGLANNGISIPAHNKYLSLPNYDFVINCEDLEAYGISEIDTMDFTLSVRTGWMGDTICETPVHLDMNEINSMADTEVESEIEETENETIQKKESETELAYNEASNMKPEDISYNQLGVASYHGIPILKKETEWCESGAIYRSIAENVVGFYIIGEMLYGNYDEDVFRRIFDIEKPSSFEEAKPYFDKVQDLIKNDDNNEGIWNSFKNAETITGNFDYSNNVAIFSIDDLQATANELGISEKMLGYILAVFNEYGSEVEFDNNSCMVNCDPRGIINNE